MSKFLQTGQRKQSWVDGWLASRVGVLAEKLTTSNSAKTPRVAPFTRSRGPAWQRVSVSMARWATLIVAGMMPGLESGQAAVIRWTKTSNRIYVTGSGFATLSDVKAAQAEAPLEQVAPGV